MDYLLTPWCRVLLEKLIGLQLVKKFLAFHETRRFITALTSVRHLSLSWASPIQSIYPHPTSWRSILILSTHLRLRSPHWSSSLRFPHQEPIHPLSSPIRATCPTHLIFLDFITRTILGEEYKSLGSSLCNLLHSPVTSSLLGPNILHNTMFSNTLSFLSSRNVNDQVSHPYKITGKIINFMGMVTEWSIEIWRSSIHWAVIVREKRDYSLKMQGFVPLKVVKYIRLSRGLDIPTFLLASYPMSSALSVQQQNT